MPKAKGDSALYRIRDGLNLTQEEFAQQTGIPKATIASIECGRRSLGPNVMEKIQAAFPGLDSNSETVPAKLLEIGFETSAMGKVYLALRPLSSKSRERVISWVLERLNSDEKE